MKLLGLNSPLIFLISIIIIVILGPKRIEKTWLLFQRFLKFLLTNEDNSNDVKQNSDLLEEENEQDLTYSEVKDVKV